MNLRRPRVVSFAVIENTMIRTVVFDSGRRYEHRCDLASYQQVATCFAGGRKHTMATLREATGLPFTRINIALEFLKERGCVLTVGRQNAAASGFLFEDAMLEWTALAAATGSA